MQNELEVLEALKDKAFAEKIFTLQTPEEVQKAFKEDKNLELSLDDIEELRQIILESVGKLQNGEVTEEDLLNVAGGKMSTGGKIALGTLGATALAGAGFLAGHNVSSYKDGGWKGFFSGVKDDIATPFLLAGNAIKGEKNK